MNVYRQLSVVELDVQTSESCRKYFEESAQARQAEAAAAAVEAALAAQRVQSEAKFISTPRSRWSTCFEREICRSETVYFAVNLSFYVQNLYLIFVL